LLVGVSFSGLLSMTALSPLWADDAVPAIHVSGGGESGISLDMVAWRDALHGAAAPVDFTYLGNDSVDGRAALLSNRANFAVSSVPFTDDELASRPAGAAPFISAPVSVQSLSLLFAVDTTAYRDATFDPAGCEIDPAQADNCEEVDTLPSGDIAPSPKLILGMISRTNSGDDFHSSEWKSSLNDPALVLTKPNHAPFFIGLTEGASSNKYLIDYLKVIAPTNFAALTASSPKYHWERAGEGLPLGLLAGSVFTRLSFDTLFRLMGTYGNPSTTDPSASGGWAASVAAMPTQTVSRLTTTYPSQTSQLTYITAKVQNANGDTVAPTPDAVQKALDAGGEQPNYAAGHKVAGAYPMVYINRLYAPSIGLSMDKTNAVAAIMRYIATDGQQRIVDEGGVALTPAMKTEALAAADQLVVSNCTGSDEMVATGGPGPNEPATPRVAAIGQMKHCVVRPLPTTTTVPDSTDAPTTITPDTVAPDTTLAPTTVAETTTADTTTTTTATTTTTTTTTTVAPATARRSTTQTAPKTVAATTTTPPTDAPTEAPPTEPVTEPPTEPLTGPAPTDTIGVTVPPVTRPAVVAPATFSTALPMGAPSDGRGGFKKLGTFMLGAIGFLLGRAIYVRRLSGS